MYFFTAALTSPAVSEASFVSKATSQAKVRPGERILGDARGQRPVLGARQPTLLEIGASRLLHLGGGKALARGAL
jgi:hypothetical protein